MSTFFDYLIHYQEAIRKFFVALGAAVAQLIVVWTTGEPESVITGPEWLIVFLAFLGAMGVYTVPNSSVSRDQ